MELNAKKRKALEIMRKRAELRERDKIRQAYFARIEKEKKGQLYYTQALERGWYNVIGPGGTAINTKSLRLDHAKALAEEMNNGDCS